MEFKYISINGASPFERGRQHGEQAGDLIRTGIRHYQDSFEAKGAQWKWVQNKAMQFVHFLEKDYSDLLDECRGIAEGAAVDFEDVMVLNCRYELLKFPIQECTSFALMPQVTSTGHVIMGMNWDNVKWMQNSALLMNVDERNGIRYFCMTEAGQMIRHGFNNFGVGVATNNLLSTGDRDDVGVPTNFMRRRILTSRSLEEAAEAVRTAPRAVSCNLLAASGEGIAADLEVNPLKHIRLNPRNGILTHANHFVGDRSIDRSSGGKFRDERLYELLFRKRGSIDVSFIKECLTDHYKKNADSHEAICKHSPLEGESVGQDPATISVTIASQIYDLTDHTAEICFGNPCEGTYTRYAL